MTVRELMEMLGKCDMDMVVRMPDTYWQSEGYGSHADDVEYFMPRVGGVYVSKEGYVEIFAVDPDEEDEDEDEEEDGEDWDE